MEAIDMNYGPIIKRMTNACKLAGGKVSLLRFMADQPAEGMRITPDHYYELFQRGVFHYGDGYFWLPDMEKTGHVDSNALLMDMLSNTKKGLSIEILFRTTPAGTIPATLKFQFAKFYYDLDSEATLDLYADYLDSVSFNDAGVFDYQQYHYYLTELFGETVTEKHIDLVRLSVKKGLVRERKERNDLTDRRERLMQELAEIDTKLGELPDA